MASRIGMARAMFRNHKGAQEAFPRVHYAVYILMVPTYVSLFSAFALVLCVSIPDPFFALVVPSPFCCSCIVRTRAAHYEYIASTPTGLTYAAFALNTFTPPSWQPTGYACTFVLTRTSLLCGHREVYNRLRTERGRRLVLRAVTTHQPCCARK